jgi:hypothetical protein
MRKLVQIFALVAIGFFGLMTTGCNSSKKKVIYPQTVPVTVTVTTDTTIKVTETTNKVADRYDCNGKKLKNPKLLSVDTTTVDLNISQTGTKNIDVDCKPCLEAAGIFPGNPNDGSNNNDSASSNSGSTSSSSSSGFPEWLAKLFYALIAVALLALVGYGLWWLYTQKPQRRNNNSSSTKTNFMSTDAQDHKRLAELRALAGTCSTAGNGKAYVKDSTPGNEMEMIIGDTNAKPAASIITIKNNSGIIYIGNDIQGDANASSTPVEPKKDDPATPAAQQ